ncbi:hypothetical protein SY88_11130 [Clostridiales bacterium PH28_bin88]|nr:hypothetical protein SY88_11130 [Clostridiales bacterium PH28_bin88]
MSLYAAIDIGTNSTRLLVAEVLRGRVYPVHTAMDITRLGEGLQESPVLSEEAMNRTFKALTGFQETMGKYPLEGLDVVATSAVRDAKNGTGFAAQASHVLGVPVRVISGGEEARLSYRGAVTATGADGDPVVVDIGGGSTEIIYRLRTGEFMFHSNDVGAVRCTENGHSEEDILKVLRPDINRIRELPEVFLIGVGGSITTLAALEQEMVTYNPDAVHGYLLPYQAVVRWKTALSSMPLEERKRVPGLQPGRADIIVAGITILLVILKYLDAPGLTVSEADILHGMVLEMAERG